MDGFKDAGRPTVTYIVNYPEYPNGGMTCPVCKKGAITWCAKCKRYTCHNPKCPKYPYTFTFKEGVMQK